MAQSSSPSPATTNKPTGPVQKQRLNVYTMMLILSFMAITAACVLLWMELWEYNSDAKAWIERWWDTKSATPTVTSWLGDSVRDLIGRA